MYYETVRQCVATNKRVGDESSMKLIIGKDKICVDLLALFH